MPLLSVGADQRYVVVFFVYPPPLIRLIVLLLHVNRTADGPKLADDEKVFLVEPSTQLFFKADANASEGVGTLYVTSRYT